MTSHLAVVNIAARVSEVQHAPWFPCYTLGEGERGHGDSWDELNL